MLASKGGAYLSGTPEGYLHFPQILLVWKGLHIQTLLLIWPFRKLQKGYITLAPEWKVIMHLENKCVNYNGKQFYSMAPKNF